MLVANYISIDVFGLTYLQGLLGPIGRAVLLGDRTHENYGQ